MLTICRDTANFLPRTVCAVRGDEEGKTIISLSRGKRADSDLFKAVNFIYHSLGRNARNERETHQTIR